MLNKLFSYMKDNGPVAPETPKGAVFSQFLGKVTVTEHDESSDKECGQQGSLKYKQVCFNICGLPKFNGKYPVASPMFDTVREMKVGDLILVRDFGSGCLHTFFYVPYREDDFVGFWNRNSVISVSNPNQTKIMVFKKDQDLKTPEDAENEENAECSIVLKYLGQSDSNITIRSKDTSVVISSDNSVVVTTKNVLIRGDVKITGNLTVSNSATVNGEVTAGTKKVKLSDHVHPVSGSNEGGTVVFVPPGSTGGPQ